MFSGCGWLLSPTVLPPRLAHLLVLVFVVHEAQRGGRRLRTHTQVLQLRVVFAPNIVSNLWVLNSGFKV